MVSEGNQKEIDAAGLSFLLGVPRWRPRRAPAPTGLRSKVAELRSMLDQAADRDGSDVAGCRHGLCEGEADVDQR